MLPAEDGSATSDDCDEVVIDEPTTALVEEAAEVVEAVVPGDPMLFAEPTSPDNKGAACPDTSNASISSGLKLSAANGLAADISEFVLTVVAELMFRFELLVLLLFEAFNESMQGEGPFEEKPKVSGFAVVTGIIELVVSTEVDVLVFTEEVDL